MAAVSLADIAHSSTTARIKALKLLDATVGRWLARGVRAVAATALPVGTGTIRRILVIRPGGIGDAVLLVPFLKELARAYPQAAIDVVAERRNAAIFRLIEPTVIGRVYQFDERPLHTWQAVSHGGYDLVFDTEQWHHLSAVLAAASGARVRVGFDTNPARNACYTVRVPYSHQDFEGRSFLQMLSTVTGQQPQVDWSRAFLALPADAVTWAQQQVADRRMIAVSVRGGIRERCWEPEKFQALFPKLLDEGWDVCVLGGTSDAALADRLCASLPQQRVLNLTGTTSLIQAAAVLSKCRLFLGTDSGLLHLAYGVGAPVIALFGASSEAKWAPPPEARRKILDHHLSCSPCSRFGYAPRCPINVQCLREISAEEVWDAMHG